MYKLKRFFGAINPLNLYKEYLHYKRAKCVKPDQFEQKSLRHTKSSFEAVYQNCWQRYATGRFKKMPTMTIIESKKAFAAGWAYAQESKEQGLI